MQRSRRFLRASCKVRSAAVQTCSTNPRGGGAMKGRLAVSATLCAAALALTVAACGGDSGGSSGGAASAPTKQTLSDKPMTLTFLWFEWPPAHALEELGKEYTKTRPNVTIKVNTVPNPQ